MANTIDTVAPEVILRKIIDGSITEFEDNITSIAELRLNRLSSLTKLSLPSCTNLVGYGSLSYLGSAKVYVPGITTLGVYNGGGSATYAFPGLTTTSGDQFRPSSPKSGGGALVVDFGPNMHKVEARCFYQAKVPTIILRSTTVVPAGSLNAFGIGAATDAQSACYNSTFYIPKVLYDELQTGTANDYYAATNWSSAITRINLHFAQIEGSEYEHYYADGTPIPES